MTTSHKKLDMKKFAFTLLVTSALIPLASCGDDGDTINRIVYPEPEAAEARSRESALTSSATADDFAFGSVGATSSVQTAVNMAVNTNNAYYIKSSSVADDGSVDLVLEASVPDRSGALTAGMTTLGDTATVTVAAGEADVDSNPDLLTLGEGSNTADPISLDKAVLTSMVGEDTEAEIRKINSYSYLYVQNRAGYEQADEPGGTADEIATETAARIADVSYIEYHSVGYLAPDDTDSDDDPEERVRVEFVTFPNYQILDSDNANAGGTALNSGPRIALGIWGTATTATDIASDDTDNTRGTLKYRGPLLSEHTLVASHTDSSDANNNRSVTFEGMNTPEIAIVVDFGSATDPFTYQINNAKLEVTSGTHTGSDTAALAPGVDGEQGGADDARVSGTGGMATLTIDGSGTISSGVLTGNLDRVVIDLTAITLDLTAEAEDADDADTETAISASTITIAPAENSTNPLATGVLQGWFYSDNRDTNDDTAGNQGEDITAALAGIVDFGVSGVTHDMGVVGTGDRGTIELTGVDAGDDDIDEREWTFTHDILGVFLAEKY